MDSATRKQLAEQETQAEIRKQIALLQAQLDSGNASLPPADVPAPPKRKQPSSKVLVPGTPSKKVKHTGNGARTHKNVPAANVGSTYTQQRSFTASSIAPPSFPLQRQKLIPAPAAPTSSTVLQKLAQSHSHKGKSAVQEVVSRSNAFSAKPPLVTPPSDTNAGDGNQRDENLALVEELPLGPAEHKSPFDDPHFEKLEPNSGIRLSSRSILHEDFQDHLRGRYYLSPSKLYSVVRLLPNKQGYDVPVCGDWLTIAVVAERGKMKYTQAPVGITREDKLQHETDEDRMDELSLDGPAQPGPSRPFQKRQKAQEEGTKSGGKKYVNMKLVDFGCRSGGSSADGGKAKIRGDAFLSLLLFESDTCDIVTKEDGTKEKIYRGGSRGAFERISKLREGAVIALLNPKILKPFQRSADKPHPTENILALTPESDASIDVIGYAQDLGMCRAMKRDGTRCNSWCDKRVSDVCDYHIQHAVERRRAARPEFAVGSGGMSTSAKKKSAYDPARQWGLKPDTQPSGATYVVAGHIISGSDSRSMYIGETVGREAQAKAARKVAAADADKALQRLLSQDKEGTRALVSAREFSKRQADAVKEEGKKGAQGKMKMKAGVTAKGQTDASTSADGDADEGEKPRKSAYSAQLIKHLGFDPTTKDGRAAKDANVQKKLDALAALTAGRKIELGRRPGKKSSCVRQPSGASKSATAPSSVTDDDLEYADEPGISLDFLDSDEELEESGRATGLSEVMVDLDGSDG